MPFVKDDLRQVNDVVLGQRQRFDLRKTPLHLDVRNHFSQRLRIVDECGRSGVKQEVIEIR